MAEPTAVQSVASDTVASHTFLQRGVSCSRVQGQIPGNCLRDSIILTRALAGPVAMGKPPASLSLHPLPGSKWSNGGPHGPLTPLCLIHSDATHSKHISKVDSGLEKASDSSANGQNLISEKDLAICI